MYRYCKEKLYSDHSICLLTAKVGCSPSLKCRVVIPCADTRVQRERVTHRVLSVRVIRFVHIGHTHPKEWFIIGQFMAGLESGILDDTAISLNGKHLCRCSLGRLYNHSVVTSCLLLEAVRKGVDFLLRGVQFHISLNVCEVVGTVPVVQTTQADQLMVFRELVAIGDFDYDILLTVP